MEAIGLVALILVGLFAAFPIYVLVKLGSLGYDVSLLKARVAQLAASDAARRDSTLFGRQSAAPGAAPSPMPQTGSAASSGPSSPGMPIAPPAHSTATSHSTPVSFVPPSMPIPPMPVPPSAARSAPGGAPGSHSA